MAMAVKLSTYWILLFQFSLLSHCYLADYSNVIVEKMLPKLTTVGSSTYFACSALQGKNVQFSWTKNGLLLKPDADSRIEIMNTRKVSTLSIDDVLWDDRGEYTCVANNDGTEDRTSAVLTVQDRIKIEPLRSKQSTAGKRIAFTCNAIEGNHVRFSWTKNGKVIYPGARISIMSGDEMSALTIKSVNTNDSGEYTCIASNDASEDRSSAKLIVEGYLCREYRATYDVRILLLLASYDSGVLELKMRFLHPQLHHCPTLVKCRCSVLYFLVFVLWQFIALGVTANSKPDRVKIEPLRSKEAIIGRRVAFTCNAFEGELVRFSWTKNGKIIYPGGRMTILSGAETSTFTIRSVTSGDSGEYTCIANNDVSEDRSSAKLMVQGNVALKYKIYKNRKLI
ncbi:myosin-binding protein C, cardiac-type-like [Varroa destructor]|uniref:Ig-like domain-containing protein n=1 Tax=Varroa destructor TaxID=109461 RepID=A0A7M7JNP0_VARDE|nr:myosin-binding protein C, cardiac-type-like [Varroa destructor]